MEFKVEKEKKNPLMKRDEIWALVGHPGKATPTRDEIMTEAAKQLKKDQSLIAIDKVFSRTGMAASDVKLLVYSKKEDVPEKKTKPKEAGG